MSPLLILQFQYICGTSLLPQLYLFNDVIIGDVKTQHVNNDHRLFTFDNINIIMIKYKRLLK